MGWPKILCEPDNVTPCPVRVVLSGATAVYHAAATYGFIFKGIAFDIETLGKYLEHMCLVGGTMAGGTGIKSVLKGDTPTT